MRLHVIVPGVHISSDGLWTFKRHESDPHPKRWFAYFDDSEQPANEGKGHIRLRDAVRWAEKRKATT